MITRPRAWLVSLAIAAALAPSPSVWALDGETLIDQADVGIGAITPGDDPGYPVTITRSGKYKLTGNLVVPGGTDAFEVTADNVTIDFNGFRATGGRFGINAFTADGLTVMNGTIANFARDGIRARAFAIIQDMQITNNGGDVQGMGVKLNNNGRVIRSTITNNDGVNVYCVSRCLIAGNVISASRQESGVVLLTAAGGHLVLGNVISENFIFGIYAEGPTGFGNNTLTGNNPGGAVGGTQIIGVTNVHPNYCNPACP